MPMKEVMDEFRSVWYDFYYWRADEHQDFDSFVQSLTRDRLDEMVHLAALHEGCDFATTRHPFTWHVPAIAPSDASHSRMRVCKGGHLWLNFARAPVSLHT